MNYSDLNKNSVGTDDWIIQDNQVISEIFKTASNIQKGDMYYARNKGSDIEDLLFMLDSPELYTNILTHLSNFKRLDGRLAFDYSKVQITKYPLDIQALGITAQTTKGALVSTIITK